MAAHRGPLVSVPASQQISRLNGHVRADSLVGGRDISVNVCGCSLTAHSTSPNLANAGERARNLANAGWLNA
jgi:hypothetical protein